MIVDPKSRFIIHHRIEDETAVRTTIVRSGTLALDPPEITVAADAILGGDRLRPD